MRKLIVTFCIFVILSSLSLCQWKIGANEIDLIIEHGEPIKFNSPTELTSWWGFKQNNINTKVLISKPKYNKYDQVGSVVQIVSTGTKGQVVINGIKYQFGNSFSEVSKKFGYLTLVYSENNTRTFVSKNQKVLFTFQTLNPVLVQVAVR